MYDKFCIVQLFINFIPSLRLFKITPLSFSQIFDENFLLLINFRQIISCFHKNVSFLCIISIVSIKQFLYSQQIFLFKRKVFFIVFRNLCFSKTFLSSRPPFSFLYLLQAPIQILFLFYYTKQQNQIEKNLSSSFPPTQNLDFYASLFLVIYHCTIRNWIYMAIMYVMDIFAMN